jgi:hypothetical protein
MNSKNENIIGRLARLLLLSACLFLFMGIQHGNAGQDKNLSHSTYQEPGAGQMAIAGIPPHVPDYSCNFPNPDNYQFYRVDEWPYFLSVKKHQDNLLFSTCSALFNKIKPVLLETYFSHSGNVKPADRDFLIS